MNNENNPHQLVVHLGALTTDGDIMPAMYTHKKIKLLSVRMVNGADLAASDSHYVQVSLKDGSTVLAEIDTRAAHENGLVADVSKACNIVSGLEDVASGKDLKVVYNETGTAALADAKLIIWYFPY